MSGEFVQGGQLLALHVPPGKKLEHIARLLGPTVGGSLAPLIAEGGLHRFVSCRASAEAHAC
jgi:hypothetical protein